MKEFLEHVLTESSRTGGCGMSTRPEYYSGRGATTADLTSTHLERIYQAIYKHEGIRAAQAFLGMVQAIPVLSATDFLLALQRLDAHNFVFTGHVGKENGVYATDEGSALGTIMSVFGSGNRRDQTEAIRGPFLSDHGISAKHSYQDWDGEWYQGWGRHRDD